MKRWFKIYYYFFLRNRPISFLIKKFIWIKDPSMCNKSILSYVPYRHNSNNQPIYLTFHIFMDDMSKPSYEGKYKSITIMSHDDLLCNIYLIGKLKVKIIRFIMKDRFFDSVDDYILANRNNKFTKIK